MVFGQTGGYVQKKIVLGWTQSVPQRVQLVSPPQKKIGGTMFDFCIHELNGNYYIAYLHNIVITHADLECQWTSSETLSFYEFRGELYRNG